MCGQKPTLAYLLLIPLLFVLPDLATAQGTVLGRVLVAGSGAPVSAAQVVVPGLEVGTISAGDGTYQLQNIPAGTHRIRVERIGYQAAEQEVTVMAGETTQVNFSLNQQALDLDAVVVTGVAGGTQRRALGNVVERMDMGSLLEAAPITSLEQALSGRLPGMYQVADPGTVGGGGQIRLRGPSSASLPSDPLIYIDGVRMNAERGEVGRHTAISRLNDIDPNDIESIEVLKGPAAATLYGTEAANGVIQIVTKRGTTGAAVFDTHFEYGASMVPAHYIPEFWAVNRARLGCSPCQQEDLVRVNLIDLEQSARGYKPVDRGPLARYGISVRGGTPLITYFASFNRSDADGFMHDRNGKPWHWDTRTSARASLSLTASESIGITLNTAYTEGEHSQRGNGVFGTTFGHGGLIPSALIEGNDNLGWSTPLLGMSPDAGHDLVGSQRTTWSVELRHDPRQWVTHRLVAGVDVFRQKREELTRFDPDGVGRFLTLAREGSRAVTAIDAPVTTLDFSGTIRLRPWDRVGSASSYGLQYYNRVRHTYRAAGTSFATPSLTTVGAAALTSASESTLENTTVGVYFQQQFDWDNRIFVTGAIRMDDNSAFGSEFDAAVYPKLSATWVMHEEGFWQDRINPDHISQFRLRSAWGAAGQQPDVFASARLHQPTPGPGGQPALAPQTFGNPELGPERGEELEIGFDAEFLGGRLDLAFTRYWRVTKDAIVERPLAPSLGFTSRTLGSTQLVNVGQLSGWGTEWAVNAIVIDDNPLRWDLTLAFSTLGNNVDDLGDVDRIPVQRGRSHVEGYPLASMIDFRVVSADFVSGNSGAVTNLMCDGGRGRDGRQIGGPPVPCSEAPRVYWGTAEPTRIASLNSRWTLFNDWNLSATIDYKAGNWHNTDHLGAWQTGRVAAQNVLIQDNPIGMAYLQVSRNGYSYHRGGLAKLRELSLAYAVPSALIERFGASRARISLGARNVATLWLEESHVERSRVMDPEMSRPDEDFAGEAGGGSPPLRQVVLGINVSF